jgi:hypothetical protein
MADLSRAIRNVRQNKRVRRNPLMNRYIPARWAKNTQMSLRRLGVIASEVTKRASRSSYSLTLAVTTTFRFTYFLEPIWRIRLILVEEILTSQQGGTGNSARDPRLGGRGGIRTLKRKKK